MPHSLIEKTLIYSISACSSHFNWYFLNRKCKCQEEVFAYRNGKRRGWWSKPSDSILMSANISLYQKNVFLCIWRVWKSGFTVNCYLNIRSLIWKISFIIKWILEAIGKKQIESIIRRLLCSINWILRQMCLFSFNRNF